MDGGSSFRLESSSLNKSKANMLVATWHPELRRAKVTQVKSQKHFVSMGQTTKGTHYFTLYEAVYLLEVGQLELFSDDQKVSLQQAFSLIDLMYHSTSTSTSLDASEAEHNGDQVDQIIQKLQDLKLKDSALTHTSDGQCPFSQTLLPGQENSFAEAPKDRPTKKNPRQLVDFIPLSHYAVFCYLRRLGYIVLPARPNKKSYPFPELHVYSTKGKPFKKSDPGPPDWIALVFDINDEPPDFANLMSDFEGPLVLCLQTLNGVDNMQFISLSSPSFVVPGKLKREYENPC